MLTAEEFRKKHRKIVTLTTGEQIEIRKIKVMECAMKAGTIPATFWNENSGPEKEIRWESLTVEERDFYTNLGKIIVTSGVINPKIIDKDPADCAPDEISYQELPDNMSTEILTEIKQFNGIGKEAPREAAGFPEEPGPPGNA